MKIFVSTKDLNIGGVETSLIFLLNKLAKEGHEIDLMLYSSGVLANKLNSNINILYYEDYFKNPLSSKFYALKKNVLIKKLYRKYKGIINKEYDVSIAFYGFDNYIDILAAKVNSKNKIIWVHNDFYSSIKSKKFSLLYKLMYKKMGQKFKYFNHIVCVSKYTEVNFNRLFGYEDKTSYCYNYIDDNHIIELSKNKTNIKMDKDTFNIIAVGRLTKSKNFDKVILLSSSLRENNIKFHTYIIGGGEEYNNLLDIIKNNDLENCVTLLGNQSTELYSIMKQADLLVSMSEYESFGNVLIEAMILGIPYISNINSGSKDIYENLTPKNCGFIVRTDEMLDEILKFIKRKEIEVQFDIKNYNSIIDKKIKEILK